MRLKKSHASVDFTGFSASLIQRVWPFEHFGLCPYASSCHALFISELSDLIRAHRFFEGMGTSFRTDPIKAICVLDIAPGRADAEPD